MVMPRPPSHPHVLRTARKILGFTQKGLAERVNIATVTLQKFENGDASISREIAVRIALVMDLDLNQLIENKNPRRPLSWLTQTPLTKEEFLEPPVYTEADTEEWITRLVPVIRELLNFSVKRQTFAWVLHSIKDSLEHVKAEFQGGAPLFSETRPFAKLLKQRPPKRGRSRKPVKSAKKPKRRSP
jgi:transcriptional regulator with XRE-family HTH domain